MTSGEKNIQALQKECKIVETMIDHLTLMILNNRRKIMKQQIKEISEKIGKCSCSWPNYYSTMEYIDLNPYRKYYICANCHKLSQIHYR